MNNETDKMPETIRVSGGLCALPADDGMNDTDLQEFPYIYCSDDKVTELERQNAALKEFVKRIIDLDFDTNVADYNAAEECGIISKVPHHDGLQEFVFADWMLTDAAMPVQSKAQVAREFIKDLNRYKINRLSMAWPLAILDVLREWEAAGANKNET